MNLKVITLVEFSTKLLKEATKIHKESKLNNVFKTMQVSNLCAFFVASL